MLTHVTLSSRHTCVLDNEGSECLVAPQLPLALCGDQPGHTECSCVNFTVATNTWCIQSLVL